MKIIDLLNKIANEKEYPKIKFNNSIYEYHDKEHGYCRYYHDNTYICLDSEYYLFDILNDEVEIIEEEPRDIEVCGSLFTRSGYNRITGIKEEDKKIEKLGEIADIDGNIAYSWSRTEAKLKTKINEIIDKINEDK